MHEAGLYRSGGERLAYRVPDLVYARPKEVSDGGVEGRAELAVEILSPGDETYDKLGFYAGSGVRELLVVDRATDRVELLVLRDGALHAVPAGAGGSVTAESLGVTFSTGAAGRLRLEWAGATAEI